MLAYMLPTNKTFACVDTREKQLYNSLKEKVHLESGFIYLQKKLYFHRLNIGS